MEAVRSQLNVEPGNNAHWVVDWETSPSITEPAGVPPGEPVEAAERVAVLKVVPQKVLAVAFVWMAASTLVVLLIKKMYLT